MPRELYAVLAEVSVFSAISTYTPYASISANTYLLPPPTTIVGALSYAYERALGNFRELDENGYSPAIELVERKEVLYAAAGLDKPITVSRTVEKLYQHIYLKKPHWKKPEMAYTVGVRPVVVVDKIRMFLVVSNKDLARYCYGITRLGRKESLVAVDDVVVVPVKEALTNAEYCETSFYFPYKIVKEYSPKDSWIKTDIPILHRDNYIKKSVVTEPYVLPKPYTDAKATVHINENGVVLRIKVMDGKTIEIPIPRQVIEV